jgi:hypothetical protein
MMPYTPEKKKPKRMYIGKHDVVWVKKSILSFSFSLKQGIGVYRRRHLLGFLLLLSNALLVDTTDAEGSMFDRFPLTQVLLLNHFLISLHFVEKESSSGNVSSLEAQDSPQFAVMEEREDDFAEASSETTRKGEGRRIRECLEGENELYIHT